MHTFTFTLSRAHTQTRKKRTFTNYIKRIHTLHKHTSVPPLLPSFSIPSVSAVLLSLNRRPVTLIKHRRREWRAGVRQHVSAHADHHHTHTRHCSHRLHWSLSSFTMTVPAVTNCLAASVWFVSVALSCLLLSHSARLLLLHLLPLLLHLCVSQSI